MFTGLVQALGKVQVLNEHQLRITCVAGNTPLILQGLEIGDSIAVDGVCLTVVRPEANGFVVDASPETLRRTNLTRSLEQRSVNLEAALRVGSKLGGHYVTGHIDGPGYLQAANATATSWELDFTVTTADIARYVVSKGSIAVNGVSLTIAECNPEGTWFRVAVIPHTYQETNLHDLRPGDSVNLEGDILGKYVEKLLRFHQTETGSEPDGEGSHDRGMNPPGSITVNYLAEHGYL